MPTYYYYDDSGQFVGQEYFEKPIVPPPDATTSAPLFPPDRWPVWTGSQWEYLENHRGAVGFVNGEYLSITALGPLPVGWSTSPPTPPPYEPDPETVRLAQIADLENQLTEIDRKSIRPLRALARGSESEYDRQKLAGLEAEAAALRTQLAALKEGK